MRTSKPISTISYNTIDFLVDTLQRLKYMRIISYYEFIVHLPDKDDKKQHIHLYIEPNKVLDTETFSNYFIESVSDNDKPLKCIHWQNSKFGDWYWYSLHDKDYLKAKMLERNCFYNDKDIFQVIEILIIIRFRKTHLLIMLVCLTWHYVIIYISVFLKVNLCNIY